MNLDAIKPLVESGLINEETSNAIQQAWTNKLNEAREQIRTELRDEFASKFEHDKGAVVEALNKMVTESLTEEIAAFQTEKNGIKSDRIHARKKMRENATKFQQFMVKHLAEEIKEFRTNRVQQTESQQRLEKFVIEALSREIKELISDRKVYESRQQNLEKFVVESLSRELSEFQEDRKDVLATKVRLVSEGKQQLQKLKAQFIKESAAKVRAAVSSHLSKEMKQLREDITIARQNDFGRRIFESFASEFSTTHLNEQSELFKLKQQLEKTERQLAESVSHNKQIRKLVESKQQEVKQIRESSLREKTMAELLGTLNPQKAMVMKNLLESVQTHSLKNAFDKYLPVVLTNANVKKPAQKSAQQLNESVKSEVTGDKAAAAKHEGERTGHDVIEIKRLAGL